MGVEKEERGEERKRVVESLRRDSELVVEVVGSALAALEAGRSLEEVGRSLEERSRSEDLVVAVVAAAERNQQSLENQGEELTICCMRI